MARERRATLRVGKGDHAASRDAHNRADRAVFGGQRGGAPSGAGPGRDLQLGRRDPAGAAVRETNESRARVAAAVSGQDDGSELCADGPAGEAVPRARAGEGERLSPASVSATRTAGDGG